jgi:hypothetical protein
MLDRRLLISADMNQDGVVTVSDVLLWLKWIYFLPGDLTAIVLMGTPIGNFLEITPTSIEGVGSGIFSFLFWYVAFRPFFPRCKS